MNIFNPCAYVSLLLVFGIQYQLLVTVFKALYGMPQSYMRDLTKQ